MADTILTDKGIKDLQDFAVQILTVNYLNNNQAKYLVELIANVCKRIEELEEILAELYTEASYEKAGEWVIDDKDLQKRVKQALKG